MSSHDIYQLKHIKTPRLIIRPIQLGDEVELDQAIQRSLQPLQRWMPWAKTASSEATRAFVADSASCWAARQGNNYPMVVIYNVTQKIIAATGFNEHSVPIKPFYELGYWMDVQYHGQGLVTELVNALTRYALDELQAHRVQICTQVDNKKSIAVAKRCGFELEAIRKHERIDCASGQLADGFIFSCCDTKALPQLEVTWEHLTYVCSGSKEAQTIKKDINKTMPPVEQNINKAKVSLPELITKRIKLLPPKLEDAEPSFAALMASVAEVNPWFSWANKQLTLEQHRAHIKDGIAAASDIYGHNHLWFFVWQHKQGEQDQFLGEIWFKIRDWGLPYVTINYWFDSRHTGHGYATEAIAEALKYAFNTLKAKRVEVDIPEQNSKSLRLVKRLGFVFEGWLSNHSRNFVTNEVVRSALFALTDVSQLLEWYADDQQDQYAHQTQHVQPRQLNYRQVQYSQISQQMQQGKAYDAIAEDFANMRDSFNTEQKYLDALISYLPKKSNILDIGCGSGFPIAAYLIEQGFNVTGIDGSKELLKIAKIKCPSMRGVYGDVRNVELNETFDAIVEWWCLFHLPKEDHEHMIARFARWLKPGGILEFTSGSSTHESTDSSMLEQRLCFYSLDPRMYEQYLKKYGFTILLKESDQEEHLVWIAKK